MLDDSFDLEFNESYVIECARIAVYDIVSPQCPMWTEINVATRLLQYLSFPM